MRRARPVRSSPASPRLIERSDDERVEVWTEAVGSLPPVYGERWKEVRGHLYRAFDPFRSKLAAAIVRGWTGPLPQVGERWLYLGAASGTTASHVADLAGPSGRVYAVEKSVRPFARLFDLSGRWPNLLPILADARDPESFVDRVPPVDGVYADVAQPDQVEILTRAASWYLRGPGSAVLLALKASSMGRELSPSVHSERSESALAERFDLAPTVRLEPFHRAHYFLGGVLPGARTPPEKRPPTRRRPARYRGGPRR